MNRLRDQARGLAPLLGRASEFARLDRLVATALTTGTVSAAISARLRARGNGVPFDGRRVNTFEALAQDLLSRAPEIIVSMDVDERRRRLLPFYEAYFSNYIEGTEFTLDEAASIIFGAEFPADRPADAHDILGTYEVVSDRGEMTTVPRSSEDLLELLRERHAKVMRGRPDRLPGRFKERANRAGATEFVAPELVVGTLSQAFEIGREILAPFARAVYLMFVTAEVHPFTDGNGRLARIMMNAELVSAGEVRIVIPTVYRNNYLAALRGATHSRNYAGLYAVLAFARRWTAQLDFSSRESAEADLERTHALREPNEAEQAGIRLLLPSAGAR